MQLHVLHVLVSAAVTVPRQKPKTHHVHSSTPHSHYLIVFNANSESACTLIPSVLLGAWVVGQKAYCTLKEEHTGLYHNSFLFRLFANGPLEVLVFIFCLSLPTLQGRPEVLQKTN